MHELIRISAIAYPFFSVLWPWLVTLSRKTESIFQRALTIFVFLVFTYFQVFQHYLATVGMTIDIYTYSFKINSYLVFPLSLTAILHAYIIHGPETFRRICRSLLIANLGIIGVIALERTGCIAEFSPHWRDFWSNGSITTVVLGTSMLFIDIYVLISAFLFVKRKTPNRFRFVAVLVPILLALAVDSIGFSAVMARYLRRPYHEILTEQLLSKIASGLVYAIWLSLYFKRFDPESIDSPVSPPRSFVSEALPHLYRLWRFLASLALHLTNRIGRSIPQDMKREVGKDAMRPNLGVREANQDPGSQSSQQRFADVVGGPACRGWKQIIADGTEAFRRDMPSLIEGHRNEWVAYHGSNQVDFATSQTELYQRLVDRGYKEDELTVRLINEDNLYDSDVYESSAGSL